MGQNGLGRRWRYRCTVCIGMLSCNLGVISVRTRAVHSQQPNVVLRRSGSNNRSSTRPL